MNSFLKVFCATTVTTLMLLLGVKYFLGNTDDLKLSIDAKSLSYLNKAADPPKEPIVVETVIEETIEGTELIETEADTELAKFAAALRAAEAEDSIEDQVESTSSEDELEDLSPEDRQREVMKRLGIAQTPPPPPTAAIDVQYIAPDACNTTEVTLPPVTVKYRYDSPSIKGASLSILEKIVAEYRRCRGGMFQLAKNPLGKVDESPELTQRRLDELKYFFMQHSVPKAVLEYPEEI